MGLYDNILAQERERVATEAANMQGSGSVYLAAKGGERMKQGVRQMFGIEEPAVIAAKAQEAKQAQLEGILSKYPNMQTREQFTSAFSELMANGFPEHAAKIQEHLKNMPKPTKVATSIEEFEFYVKSGGKVDYGTFIKDKLGDEDNITSEGYKLIEDATTESGFRYIMVEGGKAWLAQEKKKQDDASLMKSEEQRLGSGLSTKTQTEFVMNREIDSAIDYITNQSIGSPVTGKAAELYMTAPDVITANSPAQGLRTNILTIQGIIGFERLQRMRSESETGGALGQVAVQELIALQGTLGNLNLLAPKEDILERLRDIKDIYNRNMNIIRDQYTPEDLARFGFDLSGKDNLEPSRLDLIAAELSRRNL